MSQIDRRTFIAALPALAWAQRVLAQGGAPPIRVTGLSQMTLTVSDIKRSLEFYQAVFGMPVQARQGSSVLLRVGDGPKFLALKPAAAGERPSISAFGMAVEGFEIDRVVKLINAQGGKASAAPPTVWATDPSGISFQLHAPAYCGGSGERGEACRAEPAPGKGLFAVRDLSHFTIGVADQQQTVSFYQGLFGMPIQVSQGATPAYAVGPGVHFLMFTGGGAARGAAAGPGGVAAGRGAAGGGRGDAGGTAAPARGAGGAAPRGPAIDHGCFAMENFNPDTVTKTLEGFGIKPQQGTSRQPLVTYISMRMPNRGGAEGGTPELYFTDPDGLPIQLQDMRYCGGAGTLGDVCP